MESPENEKTVFRPFHKPWKSKSRFPHSHRRGYNELSVKKSRKGAVRAARLELDVQAHSWIGKDCQC